MAKSVSPTNATFAPGSQIADVPDRMPRRIEHLDLEVPEIGSCQARPRLDRGPEFALIHPLVRLRWHCLRL